MGALIDMDDAMLRLNLSGEIALIFGFGGDIEIQFGPI